MKTRSRKRRRLRRLTDELAGLYGIVRLLQAREREHLHYLRHYLTVKVFAAPDYEPRSL